MKRERRGNWSRSGDDMVVESSLSSSYLFFRHPISLEQNCIFRYLRDGKNDVPCPSISMYSKSFNPEISKFWREGIWWNGGRCWHLQSSNLILTRFEETQLGNLMPLCGTSSSMWQIRASSNQREEEWPRKKKKKRNKTTRIWHI